MAEPELLADVLVGPDGLATERISYVDPAPLLGPSVA